MIEVIQNNTKSISIIPYLNSRGWTIDTTANTATHNKENEGYLEFKKYLVTAGNTYQYSIKVNSITSGSLRIKVGDVFSNDITTAAYYQGSLTPTEDGYVSIYSDGDVNISPIDMKLEVNRNLSLENNTITWSEDRKKWITFKDILPENGFSMFTNLLTVKDGYLYLHTNEATPNKFYGEQYASRIKFPISSAGVKTYHSIAIHSNKVMGTTEDGVETQLGNLSDLISVDFTEREGIYYANFLRDKVLNDKLKGRYVVVELTDEENKEEKLQIFKVVVKSNISTVNE